MKRISVANLIEEGKLAGPQVRMMLVAHSARESVRTLIVMPRENSDRFQARCNDLGIEYLTFPLTRITREWKVACRYVLFFPVEVFRLSRFLRNSGIDLVHVSGGAWQFKGIIASRLAGIPVIWHLNDTAMPHLIRWIFMALSRIPVGFVFASQRTREYYQPLIRSVGRTYVIPAPVDTARFKPILASGRAGQSEARAADSVLVGTLANVSPVKDLETLVRTASLVKASIPGIRFVVVGPVFRNQRHYFEKLKSQAKNMGADNIEFVGGVDDPRGMLSDIDIYLCTSRAESSPMAVWEAMSMARPIVSTDVGDVPRYVTDGESGFVVPVGDVNALAERIVRLARDPEARDRMGKAARQVAMRSFDIHECAGMHVSMYRQIMGSTQVSCGR